MTAPEPPSLPVSPPDWQLLRSRTFRGMGLFMVFCLVGSALAILAIARPRDPAEIAFLVAADIVVLGIALAFAKTIVTRTILTPIEAERARLKSEEKALALSRSEELFFSRLENMYEGCQIVDQDYRYHFVNDAAAAQYRMPREKLIGRTMAEARPGIELTQLFEAIRNCMLSGEGRHFDSFLAFPDKSSTWFEFSVQRAPEGVFILSSDISERKRADAEYLARQAAELANRTKSDFLANMSHELRTPLNSIIGFTEVLQDLLYGELNPKQREYLGYINASGRHLLELINEILDLSKVQSGKTEVVLSSFRLRTLVDLSITMLRGKAKTKRITLGSSIEAGADLEI
ncbi:MAG: histidine kinase dimerization/phospho-acceptor domain-containing protein, partial [Spirochaetota bacterium]